MKKKGEVWKRLGIGLSVILTVFWLFPYLYVVCCSFKPGSEVIAVPPSFFPKVFSVENFSGLLERMDAMKYLLNSLSVSLISTVIALILGALAAYAIQRSGAKLSILLVVLVLCLKMIPTSSIVVPIYELICNLGLYDTRIALVIVYSAINMPFVMWTMLSFYEGIPTSLDEARKFLEVDQINTTLKEQLNAQKELIIYTNKQIKLDLNLSLIHICHSKRILYS